MKFRCFFSIILISAVFIENRAAQDRKEEEKLQIIEVKRGDTLSKISKKYLEDPSQWPALLKYNKVANPNLIQPGMKLKVPANLGKKPAAVVIYKSGVAQFVRAQETNWKEVFIKLGLFNEDQIKTGANGNVHLQLTNSSVLRLQANTFIIVNKVSRNGNDTIFTLQQGRLQAQVSDMRKTGGRLSVRTPTAVAAVRGTNFELSASKKDSGLACYEGLVDVTAQKVTVSVPRGMGTYVEKGKPPMKPFKLPLPPEVSPADI
ncbi:MAG: FecR domain-containing protein [Spirochaetes bacterium]|nr:FecR domain-containing protein [Spirochaetota bacterium]